MHQLVLRPVQRPFGVFIIGHRIGVLWFSSDVGLTLFRRVVRDVALLMDLTALEEDCLANAPADCRTQCLGTIQDI